MTDTADTFKWWLIYGPPRTGTSYLSRLIAGRSRYLVSDWGLGNIVNGLGRVRELDLDRFRSDLRANILASARRGGGQMIDMVFKQALMKPEELQEMTTLFGAPGRIIFCIREPAGFVASAVKKFPHFTAADLESRYIRMFSIYNEIGGDIIDYGPYLTTDGLEAFIAPLAAPRGMEPFAFKGEERFDLVTDAMRTAYASFRARHFPSSDSAWVRKPATPA